MATIADEFSSIIASVMTATPPMAGSADAAIAEVLGKARGGSTKKKADKVLIVASDLTEMAGPLNDAYLKGKAEVVVVASFEEMTKQLAKYDTIGELMI